MAKRAYQYDKRIVTHRWGNNKPKFDEYTSTNGFIFSANCYDKSFAWYSAAAAEAKKDFPQLTDQDIEFTYVIRSSYNQGFPGIRFSLPENQEHKDYRQQPNRLDFEWL